MITKWLRFEGEAHDQAAHRMRDENNAVGSDAIKPCCQFLRQIKEILAPVVWMLERCVVAAGLETKLAEECLQRMLEINAACICDYTPWLRIGIL